MPQLSVVTTMPQYQVVVGLVAMCGMVRGRSCLYAVTAGRRQSFAYA